VTLSRHHQGNATTHVHHTDQQFSAQLRELKDRLLAMGGRCDRLLTEALRAVEEGDVGLATQVVTSDREVNRDEIEVDDLAVRILALRHPVGRDLRLIVTALKIVTALERIGDEAVNVAERTSLLSRDMDGLREAKALLPEMGRKASEMLNLALDAFVAENAEQANRVLEMDDEVDALFAKALTLASSFMQKHPDLAEVGMGITSSAKYLERIADLCTNIAEMVVFMVQGVDIRHGSFRRRRG
jgi:phosphate transport system protein